MATNIVAKRLNIDERRLLNFINTDGVRYFDWGWLGKATNIFRRKEGNVDSNKRENYGGRSLLNADAKNNPMNRFNTRRLK
jgi:hypothetical protein